MVLSSLEDKTSTDLEVVGLVQNRVSSVDLFSYLTGRGRVSNEG